MEWLLGLADALERSTSAAEKAAESFRLLSDMGR
jgi:hypothetical protein